MKSIILAALTLMGSISIAQAAEPVSQAAFVKGMKVYQSYIIAEATAAGQPAESAGDPATVEPSTGSDADKSETDSPETEQQPDQSQMN
jgi:hypothetical protein